MQEKYLLWGGGCILFSLSLWTVGTLGWTESFFFNMGEDEKRQDKIYCGMPWHLTGRGDNAQEKCLPTMHISFKSTHHAGQCP